MQLRAAVVVLLIVVASRAGAGSCPLTCDPPTAAPCCPGTAESCPPIVDGSWQRVPLPDGETDIELVMTQVTDHPPTGPTGVFAFTASDGTTITGAEDFNPIYPRIYYDAPSGWSYVLHDCAGVPWDETLCGYKWWHIDWRRDNTGQWVPELLTYRDPRSHLLPEPPYRYWYFELQSPPP
jgi:hypothetical protein